MLTCPICKRSNLELYMGGQFGKYQCKNCGYVGSLVLEKYKKKEAKYEKKKD